MSLGSPFADFDASATFVLVDEAGNETPAEPVALRFTSLNVEVVFDVPDTFTTGTLRVTPNAGTRWASGWRGYWAIPPPDDSVPIALTERPA